MRLWFIPSGKPLRPVELVTEGKGKPAWVIGDVKGICPSLDSRDYSLSKKSPSEFLEELFLNLYEEANLGSTSGGL